MTITVQVSPEIEAELARRAEASGLRVETYVEILIASAAGKAAVHVTEAHDMVDLFAPIRGLNLDFERDRDAGRNIDL